MLEEAPPADAGRSLRLAFAGTAGCSPALETLAREVAACLGGSCAAWCDPISSVATPDARQAEALVIAIDPAADARGLTAALDRADAAGLPRLILADRAGPGGSSLDSMPLDAKPAAIAGFIRGMLSRQAQVERLRAQASGAERLVGGLRGDLARVQEELQLAAQVQREFLPKALPDLPRATVAALWRPTSWVSGDIYDARRLDEHHLGLFVADAVGHGVPAALMTMVISRTLPTKEIAGSSYRIVPPAEALARVNAELLQRETRATRFATAVYGVLDLRTLRMRLASAGHPSPVVLRGSRAIEVVHASGGVLGVFEDECWEETEVDLSPGDRMIMHSDGFEAAVPEDPAVRGSASTERHLDAFRSLLSVDEPAEMLRRLGERIDRAAPVGAALDDITLLALRAR